jgi:protein-disulfide isomerase
VKLECPRSNLVRAIVIATAAIGVAAYARHAGDPTATSSPQPTASATASLATPPAMVPIDRLMTIVPLPDLVQGSRSASITIIEYASTTCSHCAAFHQTTWPEL